MVLLGWLVVLLPAMVSAQEEIEAPIRNVADKWVFDREGPIEVIGCDAQCHSNLLLSTSSIFLKILNLYP